MKEFARKGYKNASTDEIVKEAGISKGALFHYFTNKKDLFLYLYDYAADLVKKEIITNFDHTEKDIFARRRQATLLKMEVLSRFPELNLFLKAAFLEVADEVREEVEKKNQAHMATSKTILYEDLDKSKFKEGVNAQKAVDVITWTLDGFMNRAMEQVRKTQQQDQDFTPLIEELDQYLELLQKSFYK